MKKLHYKCLQGQQGQTSVDYLLVVAVLVLGLASALWSPALKNSISTFYKSAAARIVKPGK